MSVAAIRQHDEVDEWLEQEVQAGRLLLPISPEKLVAIVGIVGATKPARRTKKTAAASGKKNRLGPAQASAVQEVAHGVFSTARREL